MDGNKPSALKVRQGLQEFMTQSREMSFGTEFNKEFFDVVNVDIELNNLDLAFNNYKIINLTDIHIGQWLNPEYLEGVVEYVNTLKPDMITLTGDYVSYILEGYEEDLKKSFKTLLNNPETFRQMIRRELDNHEACITCDYAEALQALGLEYEKLSKQQQRIVSQEFKAVLERS